MVLRILVLWIIGGLLIIPYSIYHLLYTAQRDEYAFLIVVPLFWIFGFWGVVGPLIAAIKTYKLMKALEKAGGSEELKEAFHNNEGRDVVIDLIASENRIPKFLAGKLYDRWVKKLSNLDSAKN